MLEMKFMQSYRILSRSAMIALLVALVAVTVTLGFSASKRAHLDHQSAQLSRHRLAVTQRANLRAFLSRLKFAQILAARGSADAAIQQYRDALRIDSSASGVQIQLGNILSLWGKFDEAIQQYREAPQSEPADSDAHFGLANAAARLGHFK